MYEIIVDGITYRYASEAAYLAAEDWYSRTSKADQIAWADAHSVAIHDGDQLLDGWADILMAAYAADRMSALLRDAGEALYGPRWQSELARAVGVSDRTMRRWVAGDDIPDGVWADIRRLVQDRQTQICALVRRIP